jgi:hypothetical protein
LILSIEIPSLSHHRELAELKECVGRSEGNSVIAADALGSPRSLKRLSKAVKAVSSRTYSKASHINRYLEAWSVTVSG